VSGSGGVGQAAHRCIRVPNASVDPVVARACVMLSVISVAAYIVGKRLLVSLDTVLRRDRGIERTHKRPPMRARHFSNELHVSEQVPRVMVVEQIHVTRHLEMPITLFRDAKHCQRL